MPKKVNIKEVKTVFDDFFTMDEARVSYEQYNGEMSPEVRRLCFKRGDSVAAIVWKKDTEKALLIEQFRYPTYDKGPGWILEVVAGALEENENPEDSIRREIKEETGYETQKLEKISLFYMSPGGSAERTYLYYAEVEGDPHKGQGGGLDDEGEDIRNVEFSPDELWEALDSGLLQDAKTIIAVEWLRRELGE